VWSQDGSAFATRKDSGVVDAEAEASTSRRSIRMSVSAVSGSSNQQQFQQIRTDYQNLASALQAGNLSAAQNAYNSISQDQQNGPQPPANSPAAQAFASLGQALQSGDLSGAQQAFSSLQTDMQAARQSHGAHGAHHGGGGDSDSDSTSSTDNADKTITNEVTTTNANGTITVTTTYSDGTTSSVTEPNPTPAVSKSALDSSNSGQMSVLLTAQQQANQNS
jgi:hypothetical protein